LRPFQFTLFVTTFWSIFFLDPITFCAEAPRRRRLRNRITSARLS
jgi:hypothetical protein